MSTTWLISDTHFGHANILRFEPGRMLDFEDVIFRNIERLCLPGDTLWHLGDFTFGNREHRERIAARWKTLECTTRLLKGNHDHRPVAYYLDDCGFEEVVDGHFIMNDVLFSHYPREDGSGLAFDERYLEERKYLLDIFESQACNLQVHGHTHSYCMPDRASYFNVSVENINYCPVSWDVIAQRAQANKCLLLSPTGKQE